MADSSTSMKKETKKLKFKQIKEPSFWTEEEDRILKEKAEEFKYKNWNSIANFIPGRTSIQCSARYRRIRPGLIKGAWSKEEDEKLVILYEKYGKNWAAISKEMPHRTGKQIRDRFLNSLDSKFERGKFTEEEDQIIIKYYKLYGNSWAKIAKKLKTRTGDMVKNRFYSSLKKVIFKSKNVLKKKTHCFSTHKIKNKSNSEKINETQKSKSVKKDYQDKESEISQNKEKKEEEKEISDTIDDLKDFSEENNYILEKKDLDMNNYLYNNNQELEGNHNNNHIIIRNDSLEDDLEFPEHPNLNNENIQRNNNYNFNLLYPDVNIKKCEILNELDYNDNYQYNSNLFWDFNNYLCNSINNNYQVYQNEIDERLDKYKNCTKLELDYKQNIKEQLGIIFDLENKINQKLFYVQKELKNN